MKSITTTISFSNIPLLSKLLTILQIQLGLFGTDALEPANTLFKTTKNRRSRKLVLATGGNVSHTGKKNLFTDSHIKFSLRRPPAKLKVVRQFEPDINPLCAGRMTISGTMTDVCAELDRMVEREATSYRE